MVQHPPSRRDIPVPDQWDASSVFASDEAWEQAFAEVLGLTEEIVRFKGTLTVGPDQLAEWFCAQERLTRLTGKVLLYASLYHHADTTDQEAAAKEERARGLGARVAAATAFADPELLAADQATLATWVATDSRLAAYGHALDQLQRRRAHVRSAEVEEVLGQVQAPFLSAEATHGLLADADLTFRPAHTAGSSPESLPVTQGTIEALLTHGDRTVRRTAWESSADAHLAHQNAMANCLATGVYQHAFLARVRGYDSCLEAALYPDKIPVEVYHGFIEVFRRHLPTWHRYWRLRRRILGYDRLGVFDLKAPLASSSPVVPYRTAVDWIVEGMSPLGEEYVTILRKGALEQRWVDARPNLGKRAGAFSTGVQTTHPFVLMSYTDDVASLSTLAHELGHSLHSYFARRRSHGSLLNIPSSWRR